jgi:hypothetical protein
MQRSWMALTLLFCFMFSLGLSRNEHTRRGTQPASRCSASSSWLTSFVCPCHLSKVGHNLLIVEGGAAQAVGGTSASSPIFASIIALLNVAQMEVTGKPLGFLNPFLYQMYAAQPNAFNDITVGDNKCTEQVRTTGSEASNIDSTASCC